MGSGYSMEGPKADEMGSALFFFPSCSFPPPFLKSIFFFPRGNDWGNDTDLDFMME